LVEQECANENDPADRVEHMMAALIDAFGDRAASVVDRQIERGGDTDEVWQAIASRLASAGGVSGTATDEKDRSPRG